MSKKREKAKYEGYDPDRLRALQNSILAEMVLTFHQNISGSSLSSNKTSATKDLRATVLPSTSEQTA